MDKDKLAKSDKLYRSEFFTHLHHELRTSLNAILGITQILLEKNDRADFKEYLQIIDQSGRHLLELLNRLLEQIQTQSEEIILLEKEINLKNIFDLLVKRFAVQYADKPVDLWLNYAADVPEKIIIDGVRLQQILINLIDNAYKCTRRGNIHIIVVYQAEKQELSIQIQDTGTGIPKDKLAYIFEKYTRLNNEERGEEGLGLGLPIVKELANLMKGNISVTSEINYGSKFTLIFPIKVTKQKLKETGNRTIKYPKIILIDDDLDRINAIKNLLPHCLLDVTTKNIPMVELIKRCQGYDIVLLDDQLHCDDLFNFIEQIRKQLEGIMVCCIVRKDQVLAHNIPLLIKPLSIETAEISLLKQWENYHNQPMIEKSISSLKILLVEDNIVNQKILNIFLQDMQCSVDIAASGSEALKKLGNNYDCILMDLNLPDMDGTEVTKKIRKNKNYQNTPIIAITAHALPNYRESCLAAGMNDILIKPVEKERLHEVISSLSAKR